MAETFTFPTDTLNDYGNILFSSDLPLTIRTFQSQIDDSLVQERLLAVLSTFFGFLAVVIAAVGLTGLVSYSVTRRRREIGIRSALGATSGSLIWLVMRDVVATTAGGLVLGGICGLIGARFIGTMFYKISPNDPFTLGIAAAILTVVAAIAGYIPARRAARIDPMECIRTE